MKFCEYLCLFLLLKVRCRLGLLRGGLGVTGWGLWLRAGLGLLLYAAALSLRCLRRGLQVVGVVDLLPLLVWLIILRCRFHLLLQASVVMGLRLHAAE